MCVLNADAPEILVNLKTRIDTAATPFHPIWATETKPALMYILTRLRDFNYPRDVKKDLVACALFIVWWYAVAPDVDAIEGVTQNLKNAMDEFHVFDKCRAMVWTALLLTGEPRVGKSASIMLRCIMVSLLGERMGVIAGNYNETVTDMKESMEKYKKSFRDIFEVLGSAPTVCNDSMLTIGMMDNMMDTIGNLRTQPWIVIFKYHHISTSKFYKLFNAGVITHVCVDEAHKPITDYESNAAGENVLRAKDVMAVIERMQSTIINGSIMLCSGTPNIVLQSVTLRRYAKDTKIVLFKMTAKYGPDRINLKSKEDVQFIAYDEKKLDKRGVILTEEMENHYKHVFNTAYAYCVSWMSTNQKPDTVAKAVKPLYELAVKLGKQLHVFTLGHAGLTHYLPSGTSDRIKTSDKKQSGYDTTPPHKFVCDFA